jgi:uncharacterized RDD family membrane protein YckC
MFDSPDADMGTEQDVIGARIGAALVDSVVSFLAVVALGTGFGLLTRSRAVMFVVVLIGSWGYFIAFEGLSGQTPGKRLFGIVVVKQLDGAPCDWVSSFLRNVFRVIDGIGGYVVGLAAMLLSDRRQRVGDRAARTVVVRAEGQRSVLSQSSSPMTTSGRNR